MAIIDVTKVDFEATTGQDGIVLVDCWAGWCGPCRIFGPIYEKVAARHPEHVFAKLDTEQEKELRIKLGIKNIPTLLLYRDGVPVLRQPGAMTEESLEDIIARAEALDMARVKAERAGADGEDVPSAS